LFEGKEFSLNTIKEKRRAYVDIIRKLKDIQIDERNDCLKQIEKYLGRPGDGEPVMLNWNQVRTMRQHNISFGAHTCSHPILTRMPLDDAEREIAGSKSIIEQELGSTVRHFAYPNGRPEDFNTELENFCKELGFESVSTCNYGQNNNSSDVWALRRIGACKPLSLFAVYTVKAFVQEAKSTTN